MIIKNILTAFGVMAWEVFWPLALGFILSAFIRAFISTNSISNKLGKSNIEGLALSAAFGAVSSSCSYAAASMGRTLIVKGASWGNAVAFMIASTNLVFEIFLVIVTLLGWAFFGGEIIGGILLIVVGAVLIRLMLSKKSVMEAKGHIDRSEGTTGQEHNHSHQHQTEKKSNDANGHVEHHAVAINSSTRLKDSAGYFYMDVSMVGKDILIGVAVSAILSVLVPTHFWAALFLKNNTSFPEFIVVLWNAIVGIIVAIFAFVCSVGNILLAKVLWRAGINFGGVIAFILSDLITIPMLMVYRKYYGTKMMWKLFLVLSLSILITALGVDYIFHGFGWTPPTPSGEVSMHMGEIKWNYKAILNIILAPVSLFLFFWGKKSMNDTM